ncbi:MAG: hypothetical protein ACE5HO_18975, partial [bacterium]
LLSLLAFSFAGSGVRELQNIGWLRESFLPWKFNWNLLEIHSTYEGLTLQLGILMSFVSGWLVLYFQRIKAQKVR